MSRLRKRAKARCVQASALAGSACVARSKARSAALLSPRWEWARPRLFHAAETVGSSLARVSPAGRRAWAAGALGRGGAQHALRGVGEDGDRACQEAPLDELGAVVGPPRSAVRLRVDSGAKVAVCLLLVLPCEELAGA